jgi:hypothetical protein
MKKKKPLRTTSYVDDRKVRRADRGPADVLKTIQNLEFQIPIKPAKDMDELLERFNMPANISDIEPYQRVRDYLGFYTTEASRALFTLSQYRARRRYLTGQVRSRKSHLMGSKSGAKWQAEATIQSDKKLSHLQDQLDITENIIDMMEVLYQNYTEYVKALSREITARTDDRDRWYGRGGSGK